MSGKNYVCIHGHFYQPPRENPWTEAIELQQSAAPFHDWNERILNECYAPNAVTRVLDEKGLIVNMVNNFEGINFNVGPTLISWIEQKHPATYHRILDADRKSRSTRNGYGNAIAQVYNHMIMPLANRRDKITQMKWGIEDFRRRFGREPEAIWLPETACDEETLEIVMDEKMKYVILEPGQAEAIRALSENKWRDVPGGKIDPKHPYRYFLKDNPEKFIDIFFYDGPLSRALGFGDMAYEAKHFMDRIEGAKIASDSDQLIHMATDGETFGHHRKFADRALAYVLSVEAPKRSFQIVNYNQYLAAHPIEFAVRPYFGEKNEGTSWSCAHGVKRWKEHCGCRGNGPAEWTQHWRKPLRETLDWLRDELVPIFENHGRPFLKDVWLARDEYVQVILDRSEENVKRFLGTHAAKPLSEKDMIFCLKLLEMERHAMLMYTSCGWFFTDLSGIETVQILQYAARALELAEKISGRALEEEFLKRLSEAKSNLPQWKDGRGVYEKFVRPAKVAFHHVVSFYGIHSIFEDYPDKENFDLYCFKLKVLYQRKESCGDLTLNYGIVKIRSRITFEEEEFVFSVLQFGTYDFRSSVKASREFHNLETIEKELFEEMSSAHVMELVRKIDRFFGEDYDSLKNIPVEWRAKIISLLTKESIEKINETYDQLYEEHRRMNEMYRSIGLAIPEEIRYAVDYTLKRRLLASVKELSKYRYESKKAARTYKLIDAAREFGTDFKQSEMSHFLSIQLSEKTKELLTQPTPELIHECSNLIKMAKKMNIELDERAAQDYVFTVLKTWRENVASLSAVPAEVVSGILKLAAAIKINAKEFKKDFQKVLVVPSDNPE